MLGKSQAVISAMETGKVAMNTDDLTKLSEIFSVTPHEIMDIDTPDLILKIGNLKLKNVNRIRELRGIAGISQAQLADILGVTRAAVSAWEQGFISPNKSSINSLCELFSIEKEELFVIKSPIINQNSLSKTDVEQTPSSHETTNINSFPVLVDRYGDIMKISNDEEELLIRLLLKNRSNS
ncbi:MAG: transcriptional regulator [Turicibacter sp.]|nr:transcriptional regulator [Turicibacter sp.]